MQVRFQDLVLFNHQPFFHSPPSQENRYESFPANPIEELDYPFKDLKRFVDIVGSCNGVFCLSYGVYGKYTYGVFCLSYGVYGKYTDGAALWNPSVRKIVNIPCPNVKFTSLGFYKHLLGFGFDSATDDYKLVRIVYLPDSNFKFDKIPPLVEIYSLRSRGWRKVDNNDLKYVIADLSTSAFLNGTCHWVATKPPNGPGACDAIVSFSLGEEVFGEMEVPDCLVKKYHFIDVAVSDGSLLLVAITKLTEEGCFSVWKMKEYGVPGSWTNLLIFHIWQGYEEEISATEILGNARSFYLDTLVESLVLLDEANGVSNEHSASHGGIDKDLQKNSKGKKIADSPTTERSK
ncbi:hypothetical protein GH714_002229 [Hevea brasiliensis]|uniref:F-box associated beta-propeller type 1 domain-containing protein n=1 Tax=Hevea brasiliensis TaxID=3981 RepID=A0A6A6KWU5_HEVBR|nr:hypothetical protein GH714_002229 [Hevea brasiliensis]